MYKRIIFFLIVFGCIISQSNAQQLSVKVNRAKMEVIKSSLLFLAADSSTFKNIKNTTCSDCKTYEQSKKFIEVNRMLGVDKLLSDWDKFNFNVLDSIKADNDFESFKKLVLKDLSSGKYINRKKKLASFNDFKDRINGIFILPNKVEGQSFTEQSSEDLNRETKDSNNIETELSWISNENIVYYELAIIICLLIFLILKIIKSKKERKHLEGKLKQTEVEKTFTDNTKARLSGEINDLKTQILELNDQLIASKNIETPIEVEKDKSIVTEWEVENQIPEIKTPEVSYTKYADIIDGFSPSEFVAEENNETIFEIRIQSANKATYSVSENTNAQRYALTNADYFLRKTCKYDVVPFGRIITDKPGQLSLLGGKWKITEQAEISFK